MCWGLETEEVRLASGEIVKRCAWGNGSMQFSSVAPGVNGGMILEACAERAEATSPQVTKDNVTPVVPVIDATAL